MKRSYEMYTDGFKGKLYLSRKSKHKQALIVLGGADAIPALSEAIAQRFADEGVDALTIRYTANKNGHLNGRVKQVPLEYIELGAQALYEQGYEKVGIWGVSMGANVALASAAHFPDLIKYVIAISPMHVVTQAISWNLIPHGLNSSSMSYGGRPLPYVSLGDYIPLRLVAKIVKEGEFWTRHLYTYGLKHPFSKEAYIPVEKIGGPILLISSKMDVQVPSDYCCKRIKERLDKAGFSHPVRHLSYYHSDHMLIPPDVSKFEGYCYGVLYAMDRRYPIACRKNRKDAFKKTLEFIESQD